MNVVLDAGFVKKAKKVDVRIQKHLKQRLLLFSKNSHEQLLKNHELRNEYRGYRSINITNDYRALYKEVQIGEETVAYFTTFGTHKELYRK